MKKLVMPLLDSRLEAINGYGSMREYYFYQKVIYAGDCKHFV